MFCSWMGESLANVLGLGRENYMVVKSPCLPCLQSLRNMVESGQLSLGIPCAPFTFTHYTVHSGELVQQDKTIYGRKFPLKELFEKLLRNQEPFMCLSTDEEIRQMSLEDLHSILHNRGEGIDSTSMEDPSTRTFNAHGHWHCGMTMLPSWALEW